MAYVPNASDTSQPDLSKEVLSAAEEFRTIKTAITALIASLSAGTSSVALAAALISAVPGQGADLVTGVGRVVSTIAQLKTLIKTGTPKAFVTGYYASGDGGGGQYYFDSTDLASADNGGSIIVAADGGRWKLVITGSVSVQQFGAKIDGATNDAAAVQACITACRKVYFPPNTVGCKINSSISVPSFTDFEMEGAAVTANTGATPLFQFLNGVNNCNIYGGIIGGTASYGFFLQGTTTTPTLQAHYCNMMNFYGTVVSSATITQAIGFDKAVKSINFNNCNFFAINGVNSNSAAVEVSWVNTIVFGAVGGVGSFGIKNRSPGGTVYYSQGWSFVNTTIDNFEICHDVTDMFVYTEDGGYTGVAAALAATTGYSYKFQAPTTNLCEVIGLGDTHRIGGRIQFLASAGGQSYHATILSAFSGVPGTAIALENNACDVYIDAKFKAGSGTAVAVAGTNNNHRIIAKGVVDSTYTNGPVLNGATGTGCVIGPWSGPTSGSLYGAGRSNIRYVGNPVHDAGTASLNRSFSAANVTGATLVGNNITTLAVAFAKGERGRIIVQLPYSGANAATQNVQVGVPAGIVLGSGTGYSAGNLFTGAATGLLFVALDYYCTADGSGNVTVLNQAGNTITINNQGYVGFVKDS